MNRVVFVLMTMVLFTGAVTGCNEKIDNSENKKENNQHIIFNTAYEKLENQEESDVKLPYGIKEIEMDLAISGGRKLPGKLTLPQNGSNFPCIVLVHGSGPNDMDETVFENKPFRDLAWGLAEQGIATYRYDKRTKVYRNDLAKDYKLTLDDEVVYDAVDAVDMLLNVDYINKDKIYLLGHSLGGYSIPRIAEKSINSVGYIIMAGNVRGIDELIKEQYDYLVNFDGVISLEEQLQIDALELELKKIHSINSLNSKTVVLGAYKEYWKDLLSYNPIKLAKEINKPVLVLQGERDYQVTITEYNLWKGAFGNIDNWTFRLYPDLNHLMIKGEGKSNPSEYMIKGNIDKKVISDIEKWIGNQ
ncbi:fermentation-respiration switch protein FrsA (DUF1100 family) [Sedimentibacter acidaminivorans]|uniref:Fermentation-respiration switch protein FrsA (DUF1100 family) n=1 Tax=Sedimentibacter acidaminivorans TaxID=913099 RepID=A0ABS4GFD6_9FIRM|nr:alpha/beta hydrolase [Sedimentibacter acidaminivorans]MBP1926247.1 fermentation-respiration switch protein FrsA (DUF1100 family) [Sedimentibacter acidaminivorans]